MESFNIPGFEISETKAALKTYSYYSAAWSLWTQKDCTPRSAQSQLQAFSRLQPGSRHDIASIRQHLLRGNQTLKLIRQIPVNENPDFAMISALWLPVQTYYAIHGFGMALLAARNGASQLPKTHGAFMKIAADQIVRRLLPAPFSAIIQDGYKGYSHLKPELINIPADALRVGSGFNLKRPNQLTRDAHIAQCLNTTRRALIEANLEESRRKIRKPGKKHGVLRKERHVEIALRLGPTTVFDYLYRLRLKSNYEDPTMYYEGSEDAEAVLELVRNTQTLATMLCAFLAAILWRIVDRSGKDQLSEEIDVDGLLQKLDNI